MRFFVLVPLWPAVLVFFATIAGVGVFVGRYPWLALGIAPFGLLLGLRLLRNKYGAWPWQMLRKPNPEYDLDGEPAGDYVDGLLKPYREKIPDSER